MARRPRNLEQGVPEVAMFRDVLTLVMQGYVERADMEKVFDGAMRGLVDALDPSSAFLSPAEVKAIETKAPLPPGEVGLVVTHQFIPGLSACAMARRRHARDCRRTTSFA